jgi:hypothetical protein
MALIKPCREHLIAAAVIRHTCRSVVRTLQPVAFALGSEVEAVFM